MDTHDCMRRKLAAVCGRYCGECEAYQSGLCCGCGYQLGQTRRGDCAIFRCCVVERGLEHCGICLDFPCQMFVSHASPLHIAQRYRALCNRAEMGTTAWLNREERRAVKGEG
jgi:hypothetical protein